MNSLVVYFSKYGNTQKIAERIAETFKSDGDVKLLSLDHLTVSDFDGVNLVVVGVPTHRMNLPESARDTFHTLPRRIINRIPVAAFDTSYRMSWWLSPFTASRKVVGRLRRLGGKRIVPPETFHVVAKEGPLYDGEVERAKLWAEQILKRVKVKINK